MSTLFIVQLHKFNPLRVSETLGTYGPFKSAKEANDFGLEKVSEWHAYYDVLPLSKPE